MTGGSQVNTALDLNLAMDDLHTVALIDRFGQEIPITEAMIDAMLDAMEPQTAYYGQITAAGVIPVKNPVLSVVPGL